MANRSDFFETKLPRYLKKMIALIPNINAHERGEIRRTFIKAHAAHVGHKLKRNDIGNADLSSAAEE
jgi:hypothetical protein